MKTASSQIKAVGVLLLLAVMSLSACSDQKKKTGKVLARVNGEPITALQLEAELDYANDAKGAGQQQPLREQALEALIDRQILLDEALRNKLDRDPKLMQVIDRFRTQAIVQAYLESIGASWGKPSKAEIDAYFQAHPELFAHRKIFSVQQLSIADQDLSPSLKAMMDSAKSLGQVAVWLEKNGIPYGKARLSYTSAELPPEIAGKLQKLDRNRLFVMKDGQQDQLCALTELKESPVTEEVAVAQIERYLLNKRMQEVAAGEIARLRSLTKLEYVDKPAAMVAEKGPALTATLPGKKAVAARDGVHDTHAEHDMAGLK
ncbi:MAG: EpsD family peptidyl-prolyl cis-trans isomerase [Collimonas sp.]|uniref:EpsD family peptidyl-prolyl cis-trans isomerase n=1 Tax=Collimonas sp. TaxID=1963772 RepID=UPI00326341D8